MQLTAIAICLAATLALVNAAGETDDPILSQSQGVSYLRNFGHAPSPDPSKGNLMTLDDLSEAIMSFQRFAHLPMTGKLDTQTLKKMGEKRCGNSDIVGTENARKKRYALQGSTWKKSKLTYKFINYSPDLSPTEIEREVAEAFQWWSDNSKLSFTLVGRTETADINIQFANGAHGDGDPFDGPGQTLAHAYFPTFGGDAHFDEGETWSLSTARGTVNLKIVAAHEFGHSLGLSHSDVNDALMAPFYNPRSRGLHDDDIQAIQHLYGTSKEKPGFSTTTRKPRPPTTKRPVYTRPTTPRRTTTTRSPPVGACNGRFDAMTRLNNGSTYAFLGEQFWRLNDNGKDEGYPQMTSNVWKINGKIDAALTYTEYTDLFQGHKVYRFENAKLLRGYPLHIKTVYSGIPSNIDAAFQWSGNGKLYFMKGEQYWRYNPSSRRADPGYPKPMSVWRGIPKKVDASLQWGGKTYFFSDGMYYRFDDERIKVSEVKEYPYPRRADEWWLGCKDNTLQQSNSGQQAPGEKGRSRGGHGNAVVVSKFVVTGLVSLVMLFYSLIL